MESLYLGSHTVLIKLPEAGLRASKNPAIFLNDGDQLEKLCLSSSYAVLIGIVPNDRLSEYTPWPEKAIRPDAPDFGGALEDYHHTLLTEILPFLEEKYRLDPNQLAYGGFSLGGLAATMSLWQTDRFRHVFSLCGSFWYPVVPEYMEQHPLKNQTANIFLLNGKKEGNQHTNRLKNAAYYANQVHQLLSIKANALTVMDDYSHHEQVAERLQQAMLWVNAQLSK